MKNITILQIVFDLFIAFLWCICLWLHIYKLNKFN